jgi:fructose-1,6-bisphosphatase/inositol monophosphatase family enzyme
MNNIKYNGHIKIFEQILDKVEFNIIRDHNESALMQQNKAEHRSFIGKTVERATNKIIDKLDEYFSDLGIIANGIKIKDEEKKQAGYIAIEIIPEPITIQRALPFFCVSLSFIKIDGNNYNSLASYISFPALSENLHTVLDDKCYLGQNILRLPRSVEITANSLVAIDQELQNSQSKQYRNVDFLSLSYELLLVLQGKIDFVYRKYPYLEMLYAFEFMLKNAEFLVEINQKKQTIKASNHKFKTLYEQI